MNTRQFRCKTCEIIHTASISAILCVRKHYDKRIELRPPLNLGIGDFVVIKNDFWYHHTGDDSWVYQLNLNKSRLFYYIITSLEIGETSTRFHLMTKAIKNHKTINTQICFSVYVDGTKNIRKVQNPPYDLVNLKLTETYRGQKSAQAII